MAEELYLGIDLGGTKLALGIVDETGELVAMHTAPTPVEKPEAVVKVAVDGFGKVLAAAKIERDQVKAGGLAAPGPLDTAAGVLVSPPNLPGWHRVPLATMLADALELPMALDNDANAAGLAEVRFGGGQGSPAVLYLTVSTGIGGAMVIDGIPYRGISGAAGEFGHLVILPNGPRCGCGGRGCLEVLASGTAIARRARELVVRGVPSRLTDEFAKDPRRLSAADVARHGAAGDSVANHVIDQAVEYFGLGVASLVNAFNPERVVIGGGLTALGPRLFKPVRRAIDAHVNPVAAEAATVVEAVLGPHVGVIGAATLAIPSAPTPSAD